MLMVFLQCTSGIMLSFYFISEPMLVPFMKNEEDMMDLYNDDFLYIHERLVDYIFICMYLHMYRKASYNTFNKNQLSAWVSGATLWLLMHFSIFFGLTLSCTHLSDVTLTIAANIMLTLTLKTGKFYWWIFTNKTLNSDTVTRIAYVHYVISLAIFFTSMFHAVEMHYDWKNAILDNGVEVSTSWLHFVSKEELGLLGLIFFYLYLFCNYLYDVNEALSYEIFMWGDIGLMNEVRFFGVAPHWYFRAYMGWLIVCPHHYIGVLGLLYYICIIYAQIYLKKLANYYCYKVNFYKSVENTATYIIIFILVLFSICYTSSTLPYGKYFNRLGGNNILLLSYFLILIFLTKAVIIIIATIYFLFSIEVSSEEVFFKWENWQIPLYKFFCEISFIFYGPHPHPKYYILNNYRDDSLVNEPKNI